MRQGQTELEQTPPARPRGPGLGQRLAQLRGKIWRAVPSRWALLLYVLWLGLALVVGQVGGAYVTPHLESGRQLFVAMTAATVGLPLLIAPRPTWEPAGYGVALNLLALLTLFTVTKPTAEALARHGDWAVRWQERQGGKVGLEVARKVTQLTAWAVARMPRNLLEDEGMSLSKARMERHRPRGGLPPQALGLDPGQALGLGSGVPEGGASDKEKVDAVAEELMRRQDPAYWDHQVRTPSGGTVDALELRLWQVLNLERTKVGLPALERRQDLGRLARQQSEYMLTRRLVTHEDAQGRGPRQRAKEALLENADVEELAGTARDKGDVSRDLVNLFLSDPAQRALLLNTDAEYAGVGLGMACDGPQCYAAVLLLR